MNRDNALFRGIIVTLLLGVVLSGCCASVWYFLKGSTHLSMPVSMSLLGMQIVITSMVFLFGLSHVYANPHTGQDDQ